MDQSVLAGVGNVYRAEVLFRARLDPLRPGRDLPPRLWDEMWNDLVVLMRAGVRSGRIVTTLPGDRPAGRVTRDHAHYVYRRTGLPRRVCSTPIATAPLAARNLLLVPVLPGADLVTVVQTRRHGAANAPPSDRPS